MARFIGSPEINIVAGERVADGVKLGNVSLPIGVEGSGPVQIGIRPEAISVPNMADLASFTQPNTGPLLTLNQRMIEDLGPEVLIHGHFDHAPDALVRIRAQKSNVYDETRAFAQAKTLQVMLNPEQLLFFDAEGQRLSTKALATVGAA